MEGGSLTIDGADIEATTDGIHFTGGNLEIYGLYMERFGRYGIMTQNWTDGGDLSVHGGKIRSPASSVSLAFYESKNISFHGTFVEDALSNYGGYWYKRNQVENVGLYGSTVDWNGETLPSGAVQY